MNTSWLEPEALNEERETNCILKRIWGLEDHRLVKEGKTYGWTGGRKATIRTLYMHPNALIEFRLCKKWSRHVFQQPYRGLLFHLGDQPPTKLFHPEINNNVRDARNIVNLYAFMIMNYVKEICKPGAMYKSGKCGRCRHQMFELKIVIPFWLSHFDKVSFYFVKLDYTIID